MKNFKNPNLIDLNLLHWNSDKNIMIHHTTKFFWPWLGMESGLSPVRKSPVFPLKQDSGLLGPKFGPKTDSWNQDFGL